MGGVCQALARTIVESALALEYMEAEGLDKMLERFWRFNFAAMKVTARPRDHRAV